MTEVNPPSWQQAGSYAASQDRMTLAALMTPDPAPGPFAMRGGVRPSSAGGGLAVTQDTTADMNVLVTTGTVFVPATIQSNAGWACHNNGTVSLALTAASAANPRIDLVIAHVYDAVDDSGTQNKWALEVLAGTPAASPAVPSTPTNAVALAQVAVARNATSVTNGNITDVRRQTVALGGVLPCPSTAMPASPHVGQCVYCTDTGVVLVWNGTTWRPVSPPTVTLRAAGQQVTATTNTTITGLTTPAQAGLAHVRALFVVQADQSAGIADTFVTFPAGTTGLVGLRWSGHGEGPSVNWVDVSSAPAGGGGPPMTSGAVYWHEIDGIVTVPSSAGAIVGVGRVGTSGDTFHVLAGSYLTVTPL